MGRARVREKGVAVSAEELVVQELREQAGRVVGGGRREGWQFVSLAHLLLEHGRLFTPAPLATPYRPLPAGQCYANAFAMAAARPELVYVEGYGVCDYDGDLIHFHHAWCATADGTVVDPTWPEPGDVYVGLPIGPHKGAPRLGPGLIHEPVQLHDVLREGLPADALVDVGEPLPAVRA